jgi:hypothetical protein
MRKIKPVRYAAVVLLYLSASGFGTSPTTVVTAAGNKAPVTMPGAATVSPSILFIHWNLDAQGIGQAAFDAAAKALRHYQQRGQVAKGNLLTVIDFSKPSTQQRLFVIDMATGKVLLRSLVAHGQHSGGQYANRFSNEPDSHQSSLGFYVTLNTYQGAHGYSLRLKGCHSGLNDNAYKRDIVLHGANYVSEDYIKGHGSLGRSHGCPAVPQNIHKQLIDIIKNGSGLFVYHPAIKRTAAAKILNW